MEHLKEWISKHRALAIGGGFAFVVLLYLWLRSGSAAQPPQGSPAINAYYAAQATAAGDSAAVSQSTNQLQASSLQTQAARDVALAQISTASKPYELQLQAITQQQNLMAYQDFLAETANAGRISTNATPPYEQGVGVGTGHPVIWNSTNSDPAKSWLYDLSTGQGAFNAAGGPLEVVPGSLVPVNWGGPGTTPTPWTPPAAPPPPITFQQFVNSNPPTIH